MKRFVSLVGCCFALALTNTTQAQTECGGAVTVGGSTISVASEAGNDTANLQCALDVAIENSISSIQLSGSAYSIDSVSAVGFRGSISGVSKANTVVTLKSSAVAPEARLRRLAFTATQTAAQMIVPYSATLTES